MTSRAHGRRRNHGTAGRFVVLSAIAATAAFAPDLLEQAATSVGQLLAAFALAAGDLLVQMFLQPLFDGLQHSINDVPPEPTPPAGTA